MKYLLFLLIFGLVLFAGPRSAQARPDVMIPDQVEVSRHQILHLGDIAKVEQPTPELLDNLDAVELPSKESLPASDITAALRSRHIDANFKIPSEVKIIRSAAPISKKEVERKVVNLLRSRCGDCEYQVNVQSAPYPVGDQWALDFSQLSSKGSFLIPVRDGDARAVKWISGSVRVRKLTPVATRFISSGERIQPGDLKMALIDVTFAKDAGLGLQDIVGQQLMRSIQIGQPVWAADVKREPAARRGQIVKAIIGSEGFEISANLEAEENGYIGDFIKVKNLDTQKILSAQVSDRGVVKVQ